MDSLLASPWHWHKIAAGADVNSAVSISRWSRCGQVIWLIFVSMGKALENPPLLSVDQYLVPSKAAISGWLTCELTCDSMAVLGALKCVGTCGKHTLLSVESHISVGQCHGGAKRTFGRSPVLCISTQKWMWGQHALSRVWGCPAAPETPQEWFLLDPSPREHCFWPLSP